MSTRKSEKSSKPNLKSKNAVTVREKGAAGELSAEDLEKVTGGTANPTGHKPRWQAPAGLLIY